MNKKKGGCIMSVQEQAYQQLEAGVKGTESVPSHTPGQFPVQQFGEGEY